MTGSQVSYLWNNARAAEGFVSGVSLHSHTNRSKETLDFIVKLANEYSYFKSIISREEQRCQRDHSLCVNYAASYWTPPLTPRLAFDLESRQIAESLQVEPLVSITDHDDIQAARRLWLTAWLPSIRTMWMIMRIYNGASPFGHSWLMGRSTPCISG